MRSGLLTLPLARVWAFSSSSTLSNHISTRGKTHSVFSTENFLRHHRLLRSVRFSPCGFRKHAPQRDITHYGRKTGAMKKNPMKKFYNEKIKGTMKSRRTPEVQAEIDALKAEIRHDLRESFTWEGIKKQFTWKSIKAQFTWQKIVNPGWRTWMLRIIIFVAIRWRYYVQRTHHHLANERGDVPGWVLVVLMTTGLVTAIWTLAAPRIQGILRNSLDSMNNIR